MAQMVVRGGDIFLLASTRVALGVGIGLLVSRRLREGMRDRAGWVLLGIGAVTTIPLARQLRRARHSGRWEQRRTDGPWGRREAPAATGMHGAF